MTDQPAKSDLQGQAEQTVQPTLDEPTSEQDNAQIDMNDVLSKLEKLGIERPEQIDGIYTASQQAGRTAELLGQERRAREQAEARLREYEGRARKQEYDPYSDPGQGVDLRSLMKDVIRESIGEMTEEQQRVNLQYIQQETAIRNDKRYPLVKEVWDQHRNDPNTIMRIQTGQTNPKAEYDRVVIATLEKLALQSRDALVNLKKTGKADIPHMESRDSQTTPMPSVDDEKAEKIKRQTKPENYDGSDDAIKGLVDTILPSSDPIWS